jgi:hypothetical protein
MLIVEQYKQMSIYLRSRQDLRYNYLPVLATYC